MIKLVRELGRNILARGCLLCFFTSSCISSGIDEPLPPIPVGGAIDEADSPVAIANSELGQHRKLRFLLFSEQCPNLIDGHRKFGVEVTHDRSEDCILLRDGAYLISSGGFYSGEGRLPYITIKLKNRSQTEIANTAIFLVGGPQDSIWNHEGSNSATFLKGLANQYSLVIVPAYYGTGYRSAFPRSALHAAAAELYKLDDALEAAGIPSPTYITTSGGALVFDVMRRQRELNGFIINPPFAPIKAIKEYRLSLGQKFNDESGKGPIINNGKGFDFGIPKERKLQFVDRKEWLERYFAEYFSDRTIFDDRFYEQNNPCIRVVRGSQDNEMLAGRDDIEHVKSASVLKGVDHIFIDSEFERNSVLSALQTFQENCDAR